MQLLDCPFVFINICWWITLKRALLLRAHSHNSHLLPPTTTINTRQLCMSVVLYNIFRFCWTTPYENLAYDHFSALQLTSERSRLHTWIECSYWRKVLLHGRKKLTQWPHELFTGKTTALCDWLNNSNNGDYWLSLLCSGLFVGHPPQKPLHFLQMHKLLLPMGKISW